MSIYSPSFCFVIRLYLESGAFIVNKLDSSAIHSNAVDNNRKDEISRYSNEDYSASLASAVRTMA